MMGWWWWWWFLCRPLISRSDWLLAFGRKTQIHRLIQECFSNPEIDASIRYAYGQRLLRVSIIIKMQIIATKFNDKIRKPALQNHFLVIMQMVKTFVKQCELELELCACSTAPRRAAVSAADDNSWASQQPIFLWSACRRCHVDPLHFCLPFHVLLLWIEIEITLCSYLLTFTFIQLFANNFNCSSMLGAYDAINSCELHTIVWTLTLLRIKLLDNNYYNLI